MRQHENLDFVLPRVRAPGAPHSYAHVFRLARGQFATALKSILAFWLIIMTYVGVNFVLGSGLHSYGFGTGAVARYMFLSGGIDLGLVALCCLIYLARGRSYPVLSGQPIAPPA